MPNEVLYFVKEVGTPHRTKDLHLPEAMDRLRVWTGGIVKADGTLRLSWDDNWTAEDKWITSPDAYAMIRTRLEGAKPGIDAYLRGAGPKIIRIKAVEDLPEPPTWSGASTQLSALLDDVWREFPGMWQNWGIHVCRKIAGSASWSQHSWDDAVDFGVGNDKQAGDAINAWLGRNEHKYGGYCERLWWLSNTGDATTEHRDHIHLSLAPCHHGVPPCSG